MIRTRCSARTSDLVISGHSLVLCTRGVLGGLAPLFITVLSLQKDWTCHSTFQCWKLRVEFLCSTRSVVFNVVKSLGVIGASPLSALAAVLDV